MILSNVYGVDHLSYFNGIWHSYSWELHLLLTFLWVNNFWTWTKLQNCKGTPYGTWPSLSARSPLLTAVLGGPLPTSNQGSLNSSFDQWPTLEASYCHVLHHPEFQLLNHCLTFQVLTISLLSVTTVKKPSTSLTSHQRWVYLHLQTSVSKWQSQLAQVLGDPYSKTCCKVLNSSVNIQPDLSKPRVIIGIPWGAQMVTNLPTVQETWV